MSALRGRWLEALEPYTPDAEDAAAPDVRPLLPHEKACDSDFPAARGTECASRDTSVPLSRSIMLSNDRDYLYKRSVQALLPLELQEGKDAGIRALSIRV